jgi:pyruvate,water dikinase
MTLDKEKTSFLKRLKSAIHILSGSSADISRSDNHAEKIKHMYECFRETLTLNDSTLQFIADIEDLLSNRKAFSLNTISQRVNQAQMDVFMMAKNLDQIRPGRHMPLFDSLRKIRADIDSELTAFHEVPSGPLIVPLSKLGMSDSANVGGKMANLGEIRNVLKLNVPDGFAVTTYAFTRFMSQEDLMSQGDIWQRAEKLDEVLEAYGSKVVVEACREIQQAIIGAAMPLDLEEAIVKAFDELDPDGKTLVAVRSSAVGEDKDASHAGQFQTELNVSRKWLLDAYRWVLASTYGPGPVMYRLKQGLSSHDAYMAVGCLKMITPRCSGIIFSRSFENFEEDKIEISIASGLSDAGSGSAANSEELIVSSAESTAGRSSILNEAELSQLISVARKLEDHFGRGQDIEWAMDEDGQLFILQCRPMTAAIPIPVSPKYQISPNKEPVLKGGTSAYPGIGVGPVIMIRGDDDLGQFPDNGVLVSSHSSPKYSQVMNRCSAIVTERGSPIGHMSILSREFGIPTIVGMPGVMKTLENGKVVTVDAGSLCIYNGAVVILNGNEIDERKPIDTPAIKKLRRIAKFITPLNLVDTASPKFTPANCRSLHDVTRYVHEKIFEAMFYLGDKATLTTKGSFVLDANMPYQVHVLDVGGGITQGDHQSRKVSYEDILSLPMKSFLQGLLDERIKWDRPRAVSARGFLSVMGESIAGLPAEARGVGRASFAIIADRYMNFSTKAGYHFNTVDTYCGKNLNKNYIHFRFEGGAAAEVRRDRRCQFLHKVLTALDFKVQCRGDVMVARMEKFDRDVISAHLVDLGRLTLCSRQLDMLMDNDDSPEFFATAFLAGEMDKF